jgi:hypothetical protein
LAATDFLEKLLSNLAHFISSEFEGMSSAPAPSDPQGFPSAPIPPPQQQPPNAPMASASSAYREENVYRYGSSNPVPQYGQQMPPQGNGFPASGGYRLGADNPNVPGARPRDEKEELYESHKLRRTVSGWVTMFQSLDIPPALLREADGLVLINSFKVGLLASLSYGTGVLVVNARTQSNSSPFDPMC